MTRTTLSIIAMASVLGGPLSAQSFNDRLVDTLRASGFTPIEVKTGPTETKVEAVRGGTLLEAVYDRRSGQIIEQETQPYNGPSLEGLAVEFDTEDEDFSDIARAALDDDEDDDDDHDRDDDDDDRDDDDDDRDDDDGADHDDSDDDGDDSDSGDDGDNDGDDGDDGDDD